MPPTIHSPTVVLVEDDQENRQLLASVLAPEGITVVGQFGTARDGVAGVRELRPDVVLMDLQLPDMSGIEAIRQIIHSTWPIQVIVLTAHEGGLPTRSAHAVGAFTYLIKGSPASVILGAILRASAVKRAMEGRARRDPSTEHAG
jgi:DNA-binding NarL/FixJ family response regulator